MCYYFFAGTVQNHITSHYISTTVQHSYSLYIHVMFRFAIVLRENHIDDKYCPVCYNYTQYGALLKCGIIFLQAMYKTYMIFLNISTTEQHSYNLLYTYIIYSLVLFKTWLY